ncbi:HrpJ domain-containing protein [Lelliottia sp. WAP21]|uniref:HrpJ domain-containing protein n=1 Tax=Lelliottia sp. WAP21 TaxID=2877426 RepID=UPI001E3FBEB2|nr:HrpJ domain-containing protein [Lelliottia sp. WAP21]
MAINLTTLSSLANAEMSELVDDLARMQDNSEVKANYSTTSVALAMADDLSALLSSMLQNKRTDRNASVSSNAEEKYAQLLEEIKPENVNKIISYAKDANMSARQLLFVMSQTYNDPADVALLLQAFIQKKKKATSSSAEDELVDVSLTLLEETYALLMSGPEKRKAKSGLNIQQQTNTFGPLLNLDREALRNLYRDFISQNQEPVDVYKALIEQVGIDKRHLALEYIVKCLHMDINSHDPSCSFQEYGALLDTSFTLSVIKFADILFMRGIKKIGILETTWEKSQQVVMDYYLAMISNTDECGSLTAEFMQRCMKYHNNADKISFLQVVQNLVRALPLFLFSRIEADCAAIKNAVDQELSVLMGRFNATARENIRYE